MKTINTKISLLFCLVLSLVLNTTTLSSNNNDTISFMEVKGKIVKSDNIYGVYQVQLICDNAIQETKIIKDDKPFVFTVLNDKSYTIKIIKDGYTNKTVYINTNNLKGEYSVGLFRYEFVVKLETSVEQSSMRLTNTSSNEIKDSKNLPEFNWSRKYCKKVTPLPQP